MDWGIVDYDEGLEPAVTDGVPACEWLFAEQEGSHGACEPGDLRTYWIEVGFRGEVRDCG